MANALCAPPFCARAPGREVTLHTVSAAVRNWKVQQALEHCGGARGQRSAWLVAFDTPQVSFCFCILAIAPGDSQCALALVCCCTGVAPPQVVHVGRAVCTEPGCFQHLPGKDPRSKWQIGYAMDDITELVVVSADVLGMSPTFAMGEGAAEPVVGQAEVYCKQWQLGMAGRGRERQWPPKLLGAPAPGWRSQRMHVAVSSPPLIRRAPRAPSIRSRPPHGSFMSPYGVSGFLPSH